MADSESPFEWELAGYLEAGQDYSDGYHNFDPYSEGARIEVEAWDGDWDFLSDADYAVIHVHDADGDYYVTLSGPFDDEQDFYDAIEDWWENGS